MKLKNYILLGLIALINLIPSKLLAEQQERETRPHHYRHNKYACPSNTMYCPVLKRCSTRKQCHATPHYIELGTEYYLADR
jgi:hypothetical protein